MRRLLLSAVLSLIFIVPVSKAQSPYCFTSISEGTVGRTLKENRARFSLSVVDKDAIKLLSNAWKQSVLGMANTEAVVLILRQAGGRYTAMSAGRTNQANKFTFSWNPDIVAIIHTHPNNRDPKPNGADIPVADRFGVPVLTITQKGMFMYDPATQQTTKVHDGTDWLEPRKWALIAHLRLRN